MQDSQRCSLSSEGDMRTTSEPVVSVIIPTYNRGHIIERTINNIIEQTYKNFEIIVVDDGSTDDTQKRLASFGTRIRSYYQKNGGASSARNRGIRESRGAIIAFQDSDDEWHATKLARQVELLQHFGPDVPCCISNAKFRSSSTDQPDQQTFEIADLVTPYDRGLWVNPGEVLATRCLFFNQVVAVRREALERVGGFNPALRYLEDWDLALRLSRLGSWGFLREPLTYWNPGSSHSLSKSAEIDPEKLHECACLLLRNAIKTYDKNSRVADLLRRTLVQHRRALWALRVRQKAFPLKILAGLVTFSERYRIAVQRRIGGFPIMQTEMLASEAQFAAGN